jgi:NDP-sugar pyrophosphorylase family protein
VRALVLAAGLGTRLGNLGRDRPKPMLPVGERPLLEHTLSLLRAHGVRDIGINLHHQPAVIQRYFGDGSAFGLRLVYSHEDQLFGTAGAAKRLEWFLRERFFVVYGDVLTDVDLSGLSRWHVARSAVLTLALYRVENPTRAGIVDVDAYGRVRQFIEKPSPSEVFSDLASAGILVAEPAVLEAVQPGMIADFGRDLIPHLLAHRQPVFARLADAYVLDIGSPERYAQAQNDALTGRVRLQEPLVGVGASC